jgi:hypothetical protein
VSAQGIPKTGAPRITRRRKRRVRFVGLDKGFPGFRLHFVFAWTSIAPNGLAAICHLMMLMAEMDAGGLQSLIRIWRASLKSIY